MNAWFFCRATNALFVGVSGATYPGSLEIEPCARMTREAADELFMRQIAPWQDALCSPGKGITLFFKSVIEPPK